MLATPRRKKNHLIVLKVSTLKQKIENFGKVCVVDAGYL